MYKVVPVLHKYRIQARLLTSVLQSTDQTYFIPSIVYHTTIVMSSNLKINERLIANLKKYTDLSDTEVDEYAYFMVASDYFKLPDHRGGAVMPGNKHYRPDGTEFTIADVSYKHVLQGVESLIKDQPEDRRTEMYRNVVAGTNGAKKNPDWEREAVNPNAEPKTPFSASKAVREVSLL
jgi:hypothetical protein